MKKYLLALFLIVIITPSIAMAAWWKPWTWSIWSVFQRKNTPIETKVNVSNESPVSVSEPETKKVEIETVSDNSKKPTAKPEVYTDIKNKNIVEKKDTSTKEPESTYSQIPEGVTYCNGKYWSACPSGQQISCPSNGGGAFCVNTTVSNSSNDNNFLAQLLNNTYKKSESDYNTYLSRLSELNTRLEPFKNEISALEQSYKSECEGNKGFAWYSSYEAAVCQTKSAEITSKYSNLNSKRNSYAAELGISSGEPPKKLTSQLNNQGTSYTFYYDVSTGSGTLYNNSNPGSSTRVFCSSYKCDIYGN